jgi:GNAT superfamily N-acetyltransferase
VTVRELPPGQTALAWEALRALRPHLTDRDAFVARIDELQRPEGYRIVAAFEPGGEQARAAAGFRIAHNLAWGRFLYVDDLSTLPDARRRGHAGRLLAWIAEELRLRRARLRRRPGPPGRAPHLLRRRDADRLVPLHGEPRRILGSSELTRRASSADSRSRAISTTSGTATASA